MLCLNLWTSAGRSNHKTWSLIESVGLRCLLQENQKTEENNDNETQKQTANKQEQITKSQQAT